MRLIRDDMYLFYATRHGIGGVIERRTRKSSDACRGLDDAFELPPTEIAFLRREWDSARSNHLVLICKINELERPVIFFRFLLDSANVGFCCVLDFDVDSVATVMSTGAIDCLVSSESLLERRRELLDIDNETYGYIVEIMRLVSEIEALKLDRLPIYNEQVRHTALNAAILVGSSVEFSDSMEDLSGGDETGSVFSGRVCAACFLVFSMLARRYSIDRGYHLDIARGSGKINLKFELKLADKCNLDAIRDLEQIAKAGRVFLDIKEDSGTISAELYPYYCDVGLAGVKEGDRDMTYSEWIEKFFDGGE